MKSSLLLVISLGAIALLSWGCNKDDVPSTTPAGVSTGTADKAPAKSGAPGAPGAAPAPSPHP